MRNIKEVLERMREALTEATPEGYHGYLIPGKYVHFGLGHDILVLGLSGVAAACISGQDSLEGGALVIDEVQYLMRYHAPTDGAVYWFNYATPEENKAARIEFLSKLIKITEDREGIFNVWKIKNRV